jgi:hypothetical protein
MPHLAWAGLGAWSVLTANAASVLACWSGLFFLVWSRTQRSLRLPALSTEHRAPEHLQPQARSGRVDVGILRAARLTSPERHCSALFAGVLIAISMHGRMESAAACSASLQSASSDARVASHSVAAQCLFAPEARL